MKRLFCAAMLGFWGLTAEIVSAVNESNRPIGADHVRAIPKQVDSQFVIRFSTTIPANTNVQLLPEHWITWTSTFTAVPWLSGITYSTTPSAMNGGRLYWAFQAIEPTPASFTTQKLHWSFNTTVSTNTDPYIVMGEWVPPRDWPFVYQSTVTVFSTAPFKIGGFIVTEKSRR